MATPTDHRVSPDTSAMARTGASPKVSTRHAAQAENDRPPTDPVRTGTGPITGSLAVTKGKARKRRKAIRTTLILLAVVALLAVAVWFALQSLSGDGSQSEADDYPGPGTTEVTVTVESGDHGSDIAQTLYEAGVVKSPAAFIRAFDNNSAASTIRPGNYSLKLEMSAAGALAAMLDETNRSDNTITVNSGQTAAQIKERMVTVGGFTEEDVNAAFNNPEAIGLPAVAGGDPEGWPAPGEYEISSNDTPETIISQMVAATVNTLTTLGAPEDQWMKVLTKASILEREAGNHVDLAKVARVIENRLENTDAETVGLLQMDSTVLYGVGKSGGIPTLADLQNENPYNTYIHKGLPPGPIASPSVEAIEATLNPEAGSWLYFVTVNLDTGETKFADTLAEQEENQKLLDEWCATNGCN
ncbi:endolytic transglycosylase MltG [Actinomycetaceae bacterium MB13-C1-2]|nr:endolytic transglycosylase MltG [Actinomycetaceae bacterium MB13-C1-2]